MCIIDMAHCNNVEYDEMLMLAIELITTSIYGIIAVSSSIRSTVN